MLLHCSTSKVITAIILLCARSSLFGSVYMCTSFQLISSDMHHLPS